jgi:hypothetical protein
VNLNDKQIEELAKTPLVELEPKKLDAAFPTQSAAVQRLKTIPIAERVYYTAEPLWKWVLIRKLERDLHAFGDIVGKIDETRSQTGIVEEISDLCVQKKLKVGDRVIFTNYPLMLPDLVEATGDPNLMMIREEEIYCILKAKPRSAAVEEAIVPEEKEAQPEPAPVEAV